MRITDDAGATTVLRTDLFVHLENLPPRVAIDVAPADPSPGEPVTVSARASDPDGTPPGLAFDLDGDGTYETEGGDGSVVTTFSAGVHEVGVRASDDEAFTVSRQSVLVGITAAHDRRCRRTRSGRACRDLPRERAGDLGARRDR